MPIRALRGAITVTEDTRAAILSATDELLTALIEANTIQTETVISAVFTATPDLTAAYPAEAARALGWTQAGLLCLSEMPVKGSLPRCIRVLVYVESSRPQAEMRHQYLRGASNLRPDLGRD